MIALLILENELSIMVMSLASFARAVPAPIERPTCALPRAGASFVPSPVTATISPLCWRSETNRNLSSGRARDSILNRLSETVFNASVSSKALNSWPVKVISDELSSNNPTSFPIFRAVPGVSPVTMMTRTPAWLIQVFMAS